MRQHNQLLIAPLLALATLSAQPNPADEPPEPAEIHGTVHSITGEPIARATVRIPLARLGAAPPPPVSTDPSGNFVIGNLAPGTYSVTAERPGYLPQAYGARAPNAMNTGGTRLQLVAGQVMKGIDIAMTPQAVITGSVADVNGDPIQDDSVTAYTLSWVGSRHRLVSAGNAKTNDEGNYRISGLPAGSYWVSANPHLTILAGNPGNSDSQPVGDIQTFYPNAEEPQRGTPVTVHPGDEARAIDIQLIRRRMYSISGTVQGKSVPRNTAVRANRLDGEGAPIPYTISMRLAPGATEFHMRGLAPGRYRVESFPINTPPGQGTPVFIWETFTINDSDIEGAVLHIRDAFSVSGTVKLEGGDLAGLVPEPPLPSPKGPTRPVASTGPAISMFPDDPGIATGSIVPVQPDGSFETATLYTRQYRVRTARFPAGTYIKQINFNGQDITHSLMDLSSGGGGQLDITLSTQGADISGVVHDEDGVPITGADVILWPKVQDPDRIAREAVTATADQNGVFQMTSLAPGDYYLIAIEAPDPGIRQSPDFLAQLSSPAEEIEISEGAHLAMQLEMLSPEALARAMENMP